MTTAGQRPQLTERQREILNYIEREVRMTGVPPSIRQIGEALGISSTNGVRAHLQALEIKAISIGVHVPHGVSPHSTVCGVGLLERCAIWLKSPSLAVSQQANRFSR